MTHAPRRYQFSVRFFAVFTAIVASYFAGWASHSSYSKVRARRQFQDNVDELNDLVNAELRHELKNEIEAIPGVKTCTLIDDSKKEQLAIVVRLTSPPLTPEMVQSISTLARKGYNKSLHRNFLVVDSLEEID